MIKNMSDEIIILTSTDREWLLNLMENPPEPNEKLKEAFRKHAKKKLDCKCVLNPPIRLYGDSSRCSCGKWIYDAEGLE